MHNLLDSITDVLLMGPGPSAVHPEVYKALARPTLGHLDSEFIAIMDQTKEHMRWLMNTKNALTFPISGTGSAGMETCFVNLVEPGDSVLVLVNGVFGKRMVEVASRLGAQVDTVDAMWGMPIDIVDVRAALKKKAYKIVALVHAETSTGVLNPVQEIAAEVGRTEALFLLDSVTGLGGIPVKVDEWRVDAFYSGTQKCLSVPPGLAPASLSARAHEVLNARKKPVPNWYLDVSLLTSYWEGAKRAYHHTAPINMIYGLYQGLLLLRAEGQEAAFARHREAHLQFVEGIEEMGLSMLVPKESRLPMLNAVVVPEGVDEAAVRARLRQEYHIEIGAGLGPLAGAIWRVGLMGYTARPENVTRVLNALRGCLS